MPNDTKKLNNLKEFLETHKSKKYPILEKMLSKKREPKKD